MLAAVSHDLKTPITSLRIQAEFIEDEVLRDKIVQTLDEMQSITEATLNFAREDAMREESRQTDLSALLDSICADFQDIGHAIRFISQGRLVLPCRPDSLKRALKNILDNAVAYGQSASLNLVDEPDQNRVAIIIEDDGPGIAESDLERVFQPFVRLEGSRNRDTGGSGLGLAIARSIIRGHGGEVGLENIPDGGLRVIIQLPKPQISDA